MTGRAIFGVILLGTLGLLPARAETPSAVDLAQVRAKAEQSDPDAQNTLGNAYSNARGVNQDFAAALTWYQKAAESGFAPAQFNLGLAYELGRGVGADPYQAFKYYMMAAEQGFAPAQFNVGNMYSAGRGVGQDLFEANLWYKQAAEKGIAEAQFNLGLAYETGRGVKKDEEQAARWYKQAADRGFARAQFNLGLLLEDGRGVAKDEIAAAALYQAAAEQGFASAQNNYGLMFSEGRGGLTKDPVRAFYWLSLAARNGSNPAARDFVAQSLSPDQLATAKRMLDASSLPPPTSAAPASNRAGAAPVVAAPVAAPEKNQSPQVTELADALEKARQANTQFAETNQRLELDKARLEQELNQGSESGKLIEQLREQARRLSAQVQSLTTDKETAEREAAVLTAQIKDAQEEKARSISTSGPPTVAGAPGAMDRHRSEIAALNARLDETARALAQAQQANKELTEGNAKLQQERQDLAAGTKTVSAPVVAENGNSTSESDKDNMIANLQRDNARLNDDVKRSIRELLLVNQQLRELKDQTAKSPAPGSAENLAGGPAQAENQRADATGKQLEDQRDAAVKDAESLTGQLREARGEVAHLNEQIQQLQSNSSAEAIKAGQTAQETVRLQAENDRLTARLAAMDKQPPAAVDQSLAPKLAQAEQALAQAQQQVQSLQAEKTDLEKWSQSLEKTVNEKTAATQTSGAETTDLRQKLAEMQKQLNEATASLETQGQLQQKLTLENRSLAERATKAEAALAEAPAAKADTGELGRLKQQLGEALAQGTKLAQANQALSDKVAGEHDNLVQAQTRVAALEHDLDETHQKASGSTAGLEDLKKQLGEANQALEKSGTSVAELTGANTRLEQDLADARKELAGVGTLREELSKLRGESAAVAAAKEENGRLRQAADEASALRAKNEQLTHDNETLNASGASNQRDLDQARVRVSNLEKQLEEARTIRTHEGDDTTKLQAQLAEANQGIEKLNATVADLTGTNDRLEKDLDNAKKSAAAALAAQSQAVTAAQPDAYKLEISTLQARVKELEGQNEDERNNAAREVATLATQLQRTRETNKSLTDANRALLGAKDAEQPTVAKEEYDQLQAKLNDLVAAADEARRQNQRLTDENQGLAAEKAALDQQLADAHKAATAQSGLVDEKAALQERLEAVGTQLVKAQQEADSLQKENADATAQAAANKQAADKAQADLAALQGRVTEADKAAETQNASVAELTDTNTKIAAERDDLRKQLTSLQADNARLSQMANNLGQLKADSDRSAQQNIEALTAQLTQARRDLQGAREASSRMVEGNAAQERERAANLAQLRQENSALSARLVQAQSTLDQIASAARLGTPAATIASGGTVPVGPANNATGVQAQVRYHTVGEGDSLSRISMRYYGTPGRWQEIYQANRDLLQGSNALRVGMQLRIP